MQVNCLQERMVAMDPSSAPKILPKGRRGQQTPPPNKKLIHTACMDATKNAEQENPMEGIKRTKQHSTVQM
jgi:hypothetical protein